MAWFKSDTTLGNHPKTFELMRLLNHSRKEVMGMLHLLWGWCCDYAVDGDLRRFNAEQIARACDWMENPEDLVLSLVEAGFLDNEPLRIHDWVDFRGDMIDKRVTRMLADGRLPMSDKSLPLSATPPTKEGGQEKESSKEKEVPRSTDITNHDLSVVLPRRKTLPAREAIPEPKVEPAEALVMAFKVLKGVPWDDAEWDGKNWEKMRPHADKLLKTCVSYPNAYACLQHYAKIFTQRGYSDWTLRAVADRANEWMGAHGGEKYGSSNSERFFAALRKQREVGGKDPGLRAASTAGPLLNGLRDSATPEHRGADLKREPGNGHAKSVAGVPGHTQSDPGPGKRES